MEPITHILTGAVLARTGFNRRAAYATLAMAVAAELPDLDTLWSFAGPVTGLEHHRGITHTFLAVPFEAALVTAACFAIFRLRSQPGSRNKPAKAPPNWPLLFAGTLLALLSHLLLDWTNNYGLRPFFPFNPHWYAGSFVFIVEPLLLLILAAALILPALFRLINAEVGARKRAFPSAAWSYTALILIAALYALRYTQHERALVLAAQSAPPDATRFFANPHPFTPFLWSVITDTPAAYQLSTLDTRTGITAPPTPSDTLYKPSTTLPLLTAKRTYLGRIYLDWSLYPILSESADTSDPTHPLTRITFSDARFLSANPFNDDPAHAPLSGSVLLDMTAPPADRLLETRMDNRPQK